MAASDFLRLQKSSKQKSTVFDSHNTSSFRPRYIYLHLLIHPLVERKKNRRHPSQRVRWKGVLSHLRQIALALMRWLMCITSCNWTQFLSLLKVVCKCFRGRSPALLFALMMMAKHQSCAPLSQSDIADHIRWVNNAIKYYQKRTHTL
jgi:hypothetical protein